MAPMKLALPKSLKQWVENYVAQGHYPSVDDYIAALVENDRAQQKKRDWLDSELQKGLDSGVSKRTLKQIHADHRKRLEAA
jgi:antitoxin ParD1/3/4